MDLRQCEIDELFDMKAETLRLQGEIKVLRQQIVELEAFAQLSNDLTDGILADLSKLNIRTLTPKQEEG